MVSEIDNVQTGLATEDYKYGFSMPENYVFKSRKGLDESDRARDLGDEGRAGLDDHVPPARPQALRAKPMPQWGGNLNDIDFSDIFYYVRLQTATATTWDDVPDEVKNTFDRLGIPEAEKKYLAGVGAQYEFEVIYHSLREDLQKLGVIFTDMDTAVREYPDLVKQYFSTIIPAGDNKFAALNSAVWSGGSFVYIPAGVKVDIPLQAYFRINAQNMGQFERTLIIAEPGSLGALRGRLHRTDLLDQLAALRRGRDHRARKARSVRYTTIQNWSHNVYNLVTKRAAAYRDATHGVGGRQPGQQANHEVPRGLADGAGRARRRALDRLRRQRPAPGRRCEDGPQGAVHHLERGVEVDLQGHGPRHLSRPARSSRGRAPRARPTCAATRSCLAKMPARTPTRRST